MATKVSERLVLRDRKVTFRAGSCLVILMLLVPFVSAAVDSASIPKSSSPNYEDRPEALASLKTHIAYVGETQAVRMDGTIHYIRTISNGAGTTSLQQIHDDYLVVASSVPLMQTYTDISSARDSLRVQTLLFSDETKAQMAMFNGSSTGLKVSIRAFANKTETALRNNTDNAHWLLNESARYTLFNKESKERISLLRELGKSGINTTVARNISDQIEAQRSNLQAVLTNKSYPALKNTNTLIRTYTHEFRDSVASSRNAWEIGMKRDAMMAMK